MAAASEINPIIARLTPLADVLMAMAEGEHPLYLMPLGRPA